MLLDIGLGKSTTLGQSSGSDSSSSGNCHSDSTPLWTLPYAKLFLLFGCRENWGKNEPNHEPVNYAMLNRVEVIALTVSVSSANTEKTIRKIYDFISKWNY